MKGMREQELRQEWEQNFNMYLSMWFWFLNCANTVFNKIGWFLTLLYVMD